MRFDAKPLIRLPNRGARDVWETTADKRYVTGKRVALRAPVGHINQSRSVLPQSSCVDLSAM